MAVGYEGELQLSQFDIINTKYRQVTRQSDRSNIFYLFLYFLQVNFSRDAMGRFSVLQVVFLLQRHTGYFLIQVK